jgi:plastocyanin
MIGASPRIVRSWTLTLVAGVVLSACANASAQSLNQPTPGPIAAAPGRQLVRAVNFGFQPQSLSVPVGTVVTFRNDDGEAHTFTADSGGFDSGVLSGGQSFTFTFGTAGTFTYHCNLHSSMRGTIAVGGAPTAATQTQGPAPALAGVQPSGEPETHDEAEHHGGKHGDD